MIITTLVVRFQGHKPNSYALSDGRFTLENDYDVSFIYLDGTYEILDDNDELVRVSQDSFIVIYMRKDDEAI